MFGMKELCGFGPGSMTGLGMRSLSGRIDWMRDEGVEVEMSGDEWIG